MAKNLLKEYLVKLGFQDSMTKDLEKALGNATRQANKFTGNWGKLWLKVGAGVVTGLAAAGLGIAKFVGKLENSNAELEAMAAELGVTRDEAHKTRLALDAMGRSLEEIQADPKLAEQFESLREHAEKLKPPDISEGIEQAKGIKEEFDKIKMAGSAAFEWIGHYFFKYVSKPMEQLQEKLKGINAVIVKNLPVWSEKIGMALSWVVRLGLTLFRTVEAGIKIVGRLFDMIPRGVKVGIAALAMLSKFLAMSPIGKVITLLTIALLLLEDFFTFLDGGESLLAPLWQTLCDLFSGFTEGGEGALAFFTEQFIPGLIQLVADVFPKLIDKAMEFVDPFLEFGVKVIDGLVKVVSENLPKLIQLFGDIAIYILNALLDKVPDLLDAGITILETLIEGVVSMIPVLVDTTILLLEKLIAVLMENLPKILAAGIKLLQALVDGIVKALPKLIQAAIKLLDTLLKTIAQNLPQIVQAGVDMLVSLVKGIVSALPQLIQTVVSMFPMIIQTIAENLPAIIKAGIEILIALVTGIIESLPELIAAIPQIIAAILNGLASLPGSMIEVGKTLVKSLWDGVMSLGSWLKDKVTGFFKGIWEGVKGIFGSKAESEAVEYYGGDGGAAASDITGAASTVFGGHADGGIFDKEHVAKFAERNKPEAIIPLTKPERAKEVLSQIAGFLGGNTDGQATSQIVTAMQSFMEKVDGFLGRVEQTMGAAAASSAAVNNSNVVNNNQQQVINNNVQVYDKSGTAQGTASAVDRTLQLQYRNAQGGIV